MTHAALFMLVLALLFFVYQFALRMVRCRYCGGINEHDDHCPFQGTGLNG